MTQISLALYEAHRNGVSVETLATRLDLPAIFVEERVEAVRLSLLVSADWLS